MCTGLTLTTNDGYHLFGRSMDLEYNFNQSIHFIPRNFTWMDRVNNKTNEMKYAVLGMGTTIDNHPLLADGFNEKGLACAGLNFPGYAYYEDTFAEDKLNLGPYDLILWILSNFKNIEEVKNALANIHLVNKPFNEYTPISTLHWIVRDTNGDCIVIEKTKDKFSVYDNNIGVLTNSPTFDWHVTNLSQYINLKSQQPQSLNWATQELRPLGQGVGLHGLPGDFSPASRFVRAAFLRSHIDFVDNKLKGINAFFNILNNVSMVAGSVVTPEHKNDITLYKACMCQETGVYYYTTYNNSRITAIDMFKEDLDSSTVKTFPYIDSSDIHIGN